MIGFSILFKLLKDFLIVKSFLYSGQESVIELSDIFLFPDLDSVTEIVNNRIQDTCWVSIFLIRIGHLCKKFLHFKDKFFRGDDPLFNLLIYTID